MGGGLGQGGVGLGGVGWEVTKNPVRSPCSNHDAYTMTHAALGHRGSGNNLRSPPPNWHPPLVPLFES